MIRMTESSRERFSDVLVEEYNKNTRLKTKVQILTWIVNNVYRGPHKAKRVDLFKDALVDSNYNHSHGISDLVVNYLVHVEPSVIQRWMKAAKKTCWDKKTSLDDIAKEGL